MDPHRTSVSASAAVLQSGIRSQCASSEYATRCAWKHIVMAALWNRVGHYIFITWFLLSFYLSSDSFPRLISAVPDWMSTILPHNGLSANLVCRSETWCTRLAENTGCKNGKNSASGHHHTNLSGCIFATKARIDNGKNLLGSNTSPTCPYIWLTSVH